MRAVRRSPSFHPASFFGHHKFKVAAVESDAEDVVGALNDVDKTGMEGAVRDLGLQRYTRRRVWVTFFQVEDVKIRSAPFLKLKKTSRWSIQEQASSSSGPGERPRSILCPESSSLSTTKVCSDSVGKTAFSTLIFRSPL